MRPTTDGRGNGAFAAVPIARGTFIGEYEGDMLSEAQYWSRYPSGVVRLLVYQEYLFGPNNFETVRKLLFIK